jgi:hypothetical protein
MFRTTRNALTLVAALAIGFSATAADAAVVHHGRTAVKVNPGPRPSRVVHHGGTTVVRPTPARPAVGPKVSHYSHTAAVIRR